MNVHGFKMKHPECKTFLGIKVDCILKFKNCLDDVIKKASKKVNALSRVIPFMNLVKKKIIMNPFLVTINILST